jgi:hypothetical protein
MATIEEKCKDCGTVFEITDRDQEFYNDKGYSLPRRCLECRRKNKAKKLEELNNA